MASHKLFSELHIHTVAHMPTHKHTKYMVKTQVLSNMFSLLILEIHAVSSRSALNKFQVSQAFIVRLSQKKGKQKDHFKIHVFIYLFLFSRQRFSVCSPGCPETSYVNQADF